jgi:hypothetical protein
MDPAEREELLDALKVHLYTYIYHSSIHFTCAVYT